MGSLKNPNCRRLREAGYGSYTIFSNHILDISSGLDNATFVTATTEVLRASARFSPQVIGTIPAGLAVRNSRPTDWQHRRSSSFGSG